MKQFFLSALLMCSSTLLAAGPTTRQIAAMETVAVRRLADQNDPTAQVELARRLLIGKRSPIDPPAGIALLEKATAAESAAGRYELSLCYRLGRGVKVDDARAEGLLKQAAEAEYPPAVVELLEREIAAGGGAATAVATKPSGDATTRPADGGETTSPAAQNLALMARRGEPSAQLALARALNRDQITKGDGGDALPWLLKAAAGDDDRVALAAVKMIHDGDGPIRPDKPRAIQLYRKLAERGLREAQSQLAALAPESFDGLAKPISGDRLLTDDRLIGEAVEIDGEVTAAEAKSLALRVPSADKPITITFEKSDLAGDAKVGRAVRVQGVLEQPGQIYAYRINVGEPKYQIRVDVAPPQVVRGGRTQRYVVNGEFRNTSRQRIEAVTLKVRLFQPDTSNDETETVTLEKIGPGETRKFAEGFDLYDYRDRGATEKPRAEIKVDKLEW